MVAAAPAAIARASFSGLDAHATTLAPSADARSVAASPTPPPAPSTAIHSPGVTVVRRVNA